MKFYWTSLPLLSRINITERVVPACLPLKNADQDLLQQKHMWTAGLGAISSIRSPSGGIDYEFPFQIREIKMKIQVFNQIMEFILLKL